MALDRWTNPHKKNKYCSWTDLGNEASVESFFILPLLKDLGFRNEDIRTKQSIENLVVSKGGRKKEQYKPDYVLVIKDSPRIVIDAKATHEGLDDYEYQCSGYCLSLNRKFGKEKPVTHFILSNGRITRVYEWDQEKPLLSLEFDNFVDGNQKFGEFRSIVGKEAVVARVGATMPVGKLFEYSRPEVKELEGIFTTCHNLIWKKEKVGPTEAFYKFAKIMFIKLRDDKRIRDDPRLKQMVLNKQPLLADEVFFSENWIEKREKEGVKNPIDSILFTNLRQELESEVSRKIKKRIFEEKEEIDLRASTIKDVVNRLQHHDLFGIDEDLNGRLFENFLEATVRGRELGQFFTPRSVVRFMTDMADLRVDFAAQEFDRVLDACCGTGGFLIEAMAIMHKKIMDNHSLSPLEQKELNDKMMRDYLFGIDASKTITRIARINMYLHGDGGSRIYQADSLDKRLSIEAGTGEELRQATEELRSRILDGKTEFDVVLTKPPFAMRSERKKSDEKEILDQYSLATDDAGKNRASLKSSVMFLERYYELLKPHGKLLTVMDESVLNASSNKPFRDFIKANFLVKAVISLPKNTFVNAGSAVKTSVLYLVKKKQSNEPQPKTFMAISENVGHMDSGRRALELNDLPTILKEFEKHQRGNGSK